MSDMKVDEKILKETTNCQFNFSCLNGRNPHCKIIFKTASDTLETDCPKKEPCVYCKPISRAEGVCTCPTRIEIYKLYGI